MNLLSEQYWMDGMKIATELGSIRTVGSDFYDVIRFSEKRVAICIADVTERGVGEALLMSNLQAAVRTLAPQVTEPAALCDRVNEVIAANSVPGKFITLFYCVVDLEQKQITYTNAGHNCPILARDAGNWERLSTDDVVLGTVGQWDYHQRQLELRAGDRLVLFTDGITECTSAKGVEFGEQQLLKLVSQNTQLSADELKALILRAAHAHSNGVINDDETLIVAAVQ